MGLLIAIYIVSGFTWGVAYWLGLRNGLAGVSRRAAWARAFGIFLFLAIGFGLGDFSASLVSALVLPCCYLLGWNRMTRSRVVASAKTI
jgi:hypothetical protein